MALSKIPSIGSAAFRNTGTSAGQIPVVAQDGKLAPALIYPAGGTTGQVLIKSGSAYVWSSSKADVNAANVFQGDFNQVFRQESGIDAVTISQSGHFIKVHDEAGVVQITLDAVTGIITTPVLQASSLGTTALPLANATGTLADVCLSTNVLVKAGNLAGLSNLATARTNLGLGTAATFTVGTASGQIPSLDVSGKLPTSTIPTSVAVPAGGNANDTLVKDGSNAVVWSNTRANLVASNIFQGDFTQYFRGETGTDAVTISQSGHFLKVHDEAGVPQITLNAVTGTTTTPILQASSIGTTPIPAANITGVLSESQLPSVAITDVFTVGSQAAMLALSAQRGDVAIRTDIVPNSEAYILSTNNPGTLADWKKISVLGSAGYAVLAGNNSFSGTQSVTGTIDMFSGVIQLRDAGDTIVSISLTGSTGVGVFSGGLGSTPLNASNMSSGTLPVARLGSSGTPSSSTFLRGDNIWVNGTAGTWLSQTINPASQASSFVLHALDMSTVVDAVRIGTGNYSAAVSPQTCVHINPTDATTGTGGLTFLKMTRSGSGTGSGAKDFIQAYDGATLRFNIDKNGYVQVGATGDTSAVLKMGSTGTQVSYFGVVAGSNGFYATNYQNQNGAQIKLNFSNTANAQDHILMCGGTYSQTSGQFNAVRIATTYNQSGGATAANDFEIDRTQTAVGGGAQRCIHVKVNTVSRFMVFPAGSVQSVTTGSADNFVFDTSGSGTSGATFKTAGVTKGYLTCVTTPGTYVSDSLAGDLVLRTDSNRILMGYSTGAATLVLTNNLVTVNGNVAATAFIGQTGRTGMTWSSGTVLSVDTSVITGSVFEFNATIKSVVIRADVSSTASVELYVDGVKVSGADPITLTAGTQATKSSFTGWTLNTNATQVIGYKLISNDNATRIDVDVVYSRR